ncbi:hypothetical protein BJX99DRAFT_255230 [Aspergillus californicus]
MALAYPKIDVHSHYIPDIYLASYLKYTPSGMPALPEWDIDAHLRMADTMNITTSYLSIPSPGVHLIAGDDQLARDLARQVNIAGAELKKAHPTRFGLWISLPLPDVEGSLEELAYGLDHLDGDGVGVMTNVGGYYLGHESYEPLWAELDKRAAIVFIHPTTGCIYDPEPEPAVDNNNNNPPGGVCAHPAAPLPQYPTSIFEFFFDTTRAIINLFYSGAVARYPSIRYVIPHAGACLPPLIERFATSRSLGAVYSSVSPDFVKERLREQFYFDLAGRPFPDQLRGLLPFVGPEQILYGSDYPFSSAEMVRQLGDIMEEYMPEVFETDEERRMVFSRNAERLFQE